MSIVNLVHLKENSNLLYLNSPLTDCEGRSGDGNTPDSDNCNKPLIWPKVDSASVSRRTSLSCQSSEEKDDNYPYQLPFSYKHNKSLSFLRTDSISDSESNEKPNRERCSASPAPSESEYKRYSKRPLRGPYGQMLEAEMQKQSKNNYEEILEELQDTNKRFGCFSLLFFFFINFRFKYILYVFMIFYLSYHRRTREANRSFDDTATKGLNRPQHSNSMRTRKNHAYLPIPAHTRAASTPSQMEYIKSTKLDSINPNEKRYQSSLDNSCLVRNVSPKRAASEMPLCNIQNSKQHGLAKRSLSAAEKLSQSKNSDNNLLATPELLAALLKGSSEKLISEQRKEIVSVSTVYSYKIISE